MYHSNYLFITHNLNICFYSIVSIDYVWNRYIPCRDLQQACSYAFSFPFSQFITTLHIQYSRFLSVFCLAPPHYVPGIGRGAKPIVTRYAIAQSNSIGIVLKIME